MLDSELKTYPWNPTVKKKACRVFMLRWLFVILAAAAIFFLTYQKLTTNVWGLTAFLCQLLAVIELCFRAPVCRSRMEQKDIE